MKKVIIFAFGFFWMNFAFGSPVMPTPIYKIEAEVVEELRMEVRDSPRGDHAKSVFLRMKIKILKNLGVVSGGFDSGAHLNYLKSGKILEDVLSPEISLRKGDKFTANIGYFGDEWSQGYRLTNVQKISVEKLFSDISAFHRYFDAVRFAKNQKIIRGYDDGSFRPDAKINRAEFVKIITEAQFLPSDIEFCPVYSLKFSDVSKNAWFAKYVCAAQIKGLISGYPDDGLFRPGKNISFVEAAKIIVTGFEFPTIFDPIWYRPFVENLASRQAIPYSITGFDHEITRGEVAEIIYRLKQKILTKKSKKYADFLPKSQHHTTCPQDTKVCSDGSLVERTGTNCQFSKCPDDSPPFCATDSKKCPNPHRRRASLGKFCGGLTGIWCSEGLGCQYDGDYPDAGGVCVKTFPPGCSRFFDGCNTCTREPGGGSMCTRRFCESFELEPARCLEFSVE